MKFLNQPELKNLLGIIFTYYTKVVHSSVSRNDPKQPLPIKIRNIYRCAKDICQSRFFCLAILGKLLIFKSRPTGSTDLGYFTSG